MRPRTIPMLRGAALAVAIAAVLFAPTVAAAPSPGAQAAKQFSTQARSHVKFLKESIKLATKTLCDQLDAAVIAAISSSIAPDIFIAGIYTQLATYHANVDSVIANVISTMESDAEGLLAPLAGHPDGFVAGDCSELDRARNEVLKELLKTRDKIRKKMKKIAKLMGKNDLAMTSIVESEPVPFLVPNIGLVGAPVATILQLYLTDAMATSLKSAADDGTICLGGVAAGSNGQLDVTVNGPGGATASVSNVPISVSGRWSSCVGGGALPEGNYRVTLDQGGFRFTFDIGIGGDPNAL